ncbi:hypothetical protein [Jannaschia aquimarina]|uniref:hypothetical protein n=1 Tax=Jannaschia aquimarina TaxID=935700 RepID=UPI0005C5B29C|nr:hypothetical protein [Jannaschia aquimarina]
MARWAPFGLRCAPDAPALGRGAAILVHRTRDGIRGPFVQCRLFVDGAARKTLAPDEAALIEVAPGRRMVEVEMLDMASDPIVVDLAEGEVARIRIETGASLFSSVVGIAL